MSISLKKIFQYFLLLLFLVYYGSITLLKHTHHVENGITIVHSHPYKHSPTKNTESHKHTNKEIVLIQWLSSFLTTVLVFTFLIKALKSDFVRYFLNTNNHKGYHLIYLRSNGLRAPPYKYTC